MPFRGKSECVEGFDYKQNAVSTSSETHSRRLTFSSTAEILAIVGPAGRCRINCGFSASGRLISLA